MVASKQRTMKFELVAKHFRQNVAPLSAGQIIIVTISREAAKA
jgi:hypothetical protein